MPSYTPKEQAETTVWDAMYAGFASMGLAAIPTSAGVYAAMQFSPKFVKATNWSSRTAILIMPPLFAFAYSAESKLVHRMHEMASDAEHSKHMAEWTHQHMIKEHKEQLKRMATQKILQQPGMENVVTHKTEGDDEAHEKEIVDKFRESVLNSNIRVIPGNELGFYHKVANFWQENPFKILAFAGIPTVGYIFYGRSGQEHLQLQMKVMHTRVMGQFAVISMLLTLMGFKEYMDRSGKYVTEADVNARVAQMQESRMELLARLKREKAAAAQVAEKRLKAHEADMKAKQKMIQS
ncbi:hypothetical protein ACHAXN_010666 [Cyclotella atomus]